ncbi:MAG: DNA repair protein RecN [Bacteroidales bacterium]
MLEELIIKDYALIDRLTVHFEDGLNIITGETGAGKSIIVGALGFLLGSKVDIDVIRTGADEASVNGIISINSNNPDLSSWLNEKNITTEDNKIIIRRIIKKNGRSSIYIQDTPVTRSELLECTSLLFDIHGQHEHQALLKKESHRKYLDRFAGIEDLVLQYNKLFQQLADKKKEIESSIEAERNRSEKIELLKFAIEEITKANPKPSESEELEAEAKRLSEYEKLTDLVYTALENINNDERSSLPLLRKAKASLETAAGIDGSLEPIVNRISDLYYEFEDAVDQLETYKNNLRYDPNRLESIEERLALLYRLKKKYGGDEESLLKYRNHALQQIEMLTKIEEDREQLKVEIAKIEREMATRATEITKKRQVAAQDLSSKVTAILHSLGMPKANFNIHIQPKGMNGSTILCGPYGAEDVEFYIAPNLGEPAKELYKIASGGELSRVMLAIKTVLANTDTVETLVFDEIDTGIGGEVAVSVGQHLANIGKYKQIFCVTHLATIAVRARHHFKVEKNIEGDRTVTTLRVIQQEERRSEIARMLAGDSDGIAALAHADELLVKFSSEK